MQNRISLIVTYSVQIYSILITVVIIPLFITLVGAEAFGLIGFFIMLQTWMQVLDAGVSGSLTRQIAVTKKCLISYKLFLRNFYIVNFIFLLISFLITFIGYKYAGDLATRWFKTTLDVEIINDCIVVMFVNLSLKYLCGPPRSGLIGLERHVYIGLINFLISSLRYPGGLIALYLNQNSILAFFVFQAFVSILELLLTQLGFHVYSNKNISLAEKNEKNIRIPNLKTLLYFSGQLSLLSILWVIVTQVDKLMLSKTISLTNFGYYSLAVTVSGLILSLSGPINQIFLPRLTALFAEKKYKLFTNTFSILFIVSCMVFIPASMFFHFFGDKLIWVWTGDVAISSEVFNYLGFLAFGNTLAILANFAFILLFSVGRLTTHLKVYLIYSLLLVPIIVLVVKLFGADGAAILWFIHNFIFFISWCLFVISKYLKSFLSKVSYASLVFPLVLSFFYFDYIQSLNLNFTSTRFGMGFFLLLISSIVMIIIFSFIWLGRNLIRIKIDEVNFIVDKY